jgi:hypothetical protein
MTPKNTVNTLDDEIDDFIALLPLFAMGFLGLRFSAEEASVLLFFFRCFVSFLQTDLTAVTFLPVPAGFSFLRFRPVWGEGYDLHRPTGHHI